MTDLTLIRLCSMSDMPQNLKVPEIMLLFSLKAVSKYNLKPSQGPSTVYEDHRLARWWVIGIATTHIPHQES